MVHKSVFVPITAIAALAAVEIAAMHYGHDGTMLYLVVTLIAGVGGFSVGRLTAPMFPTIRHPDDGT
jgi:hypothetical protein